jgi:aspartate-semialdehyde dehydrogenase
MDPNRIHKNPNVAIVGSSSLLGKELKEMVEDHHFPKGRLLLLETEEYAGLLQEFAGEILVTQIISPNAFDDIDIAFFACSREIMKSYVSSGASMPELTIDLTDTGQAGALFLEGISDPGSLKIPGYFINPHPAVIVLARVLSALHNSFGLKSAAVTVIEPASEKGNSGVDELQEQTVSLLNFQQVENRTFGGQIAFNMLNELSSEQTEDRIRSQISDLLGDTSSSPMIAVIQAPVFHSHSYSLFVQLQDCGGREAIIQKLGIEGSGMEWSSNISPVGAVGTDKIHIGRVSRDPVHTDQYSLWIVSDSVLLAASNAVQIAERIIFAPAPNPGM